MTYTHDVTIAGDVVRKRYLRTGRKEQEREWEALTLLDRHAPGLAPQPIEQQDGAVVMSRVPGEHLDQPFTPGQTAAVIAAYQQPAWIARPRTCVSCSRDSCWGRPLPDGPNGFSSHVQLRTAW